MRDLGERVSELVSRERFSDAQVRRLGPRAVPHLIEVFQTASGDLANRQRRKALHALGVLGTEEAVDFLIATAENDAVEGWLQSAAVRSLGPARAAQGRGVSHVVAWKTRISATETTPLWRWDIRMTRRRPEPWRKRRHRTPMIGYASASGDPCPRPNETGDESTWSVTSSRTATPLPPSDARCSRSALAGAPMNGRRLSSRSRWRPGSLLLRTPSPCTWQAWTIRA